MGTCHDELHHTRTCLRYCWNLSDIFCGIAAMKKMWLDEFPCEKCWLLSILEVASGLLLLSQLVLSIQITCSEAS